MYNAEVFDEHIESVASLLGVKPEKVYDMILDYGRLWLLEHTGAKEYVELWVSMPEFWVWWRQVWFNIDEELFATNGPVVNDGSVKYHSGLYDFYVKAHMPGQVNFMPNQVIFEKFHRLPKEMI